jgi:hypothetical protein
MVSYICIPILFKESLIASEKGPQIRGKCNYIHTDLQILDLDTKYTNLNSS